MGRGEGVSGGRVSPHSPSFPGRKSEGSKSEAEGRNGLGEERVREGTGQGRNGLGKDPPFLTC